MTISVGIDTGGTFTDAVVMVARDGAQHLVTKAKAPTTHEDLSIGISEALAAAMDSANLAGPDVGLVSLSTTLATNALVEGRGGSVALIAVGFSPRDMERAGLAETPGLAKVVVLPGGHTTHGSQAEPLDLTALAETSFDDVDGVAVAGLFATRNPAHEIAVRDAVMKRTGLPVTCSHELSARLNGPKRALTTVLNARLVPLIGALLDAAEGVLSARSIVAPLMVVRGNGALVRADFARTRPIETILSGPAASLVGARHLTGLDAAVVNDIGGTTSDVAVLRGGMPVIDPDGARVGAHRTMVEAVAMRTFGLGGDSAVTLQTEGLATRIQLGPRRHVPIAKLLSDHPTLHEALEGQLRSTLRGRHDGAFAWRRAGSTTGIDAQAMKLLERFEDQPLPLRDVLEGNA
ncbi:MAG: hydantoinase/oxoprolinase family protein, partial [Pseudomonadota bacterium]